MNFICIKARAARYIRAALFVVYCSYGKKEENKKKTKKDRNKPQLSNAFCHNLLPGDGGGDSGAGGIPMDHRAGQNRVKQTFPVDKGGCGAWSSSGRDSD